MMRPQSNKLDGNESVESSGENDEDFWLCFQKRASKDNHNHRNRGRNDS
jgi:hypothetical protein